MRRAKWLNCKRHGGSKYDDDRPTRYFEIGLGRCGTRSVTLALRSLGLTVRHGFSGCIGCHGDGVRAAIEHRADLAVYQTCDVSMNLATIHWRQLVRNPNNRFIRCDRPVDDWINAHRRKIRSYQRRWNEGPVSWTWHWMHRMYDGLPTPEVLRALHERHIRETDVLGDRLLVLNLFTISDELLWDRLTRFVGKSNPGGVFPHVTSKVRVY